MAMTRQQILTQAGLRFPHSISNEDLIVIANAIESELFRTIYKKKAFSAYDVLAGLPYYPLDFDISKVLAVVVDGQDYDWQDNTDKIVCPPYAYGYENAVVLVPTPSRDIPTGLKVWHYVEPRPWSLFNLSYTPDFDGDFHMILVWLIARDIAEIAGDDGRSALYQRKADELIKKLEETNPEPDMDDIGLA